MIDSFELSKIAGAVLAALLVIFGTRTAIEIFGGHGHDAAPGYTLAPPKEGAPAAGWEGTSPAAAPAAFDAAKVVAMIATAKPDNGQATFKKCLACHSAEKGAKSKAGPNLWGVIGRPRASEADFSGYSDAMKSKGGNWTYEDVAAFVHSPKTFLPGTKMIFPGVHDAGDVADVLAYMRTLSDSPPPLPQ
jgi:cytochrome c